MFATSCAGGRRRTQAKVFSRSTGLPCSSRTCEVSNRRRAIQRASGHCAGITAEERHSCCTCPVHHPVHRRDADERQRTVPRGGRGPCRDAASAMPSGTAATGGGLAQPSTYWSSRPCRPANAACAPQPCAAGKSGGAGRPVRQALLRQSWGDLTASNTTCCSPLRLRWRNHQAAPLLMLQGCAMPQSR